MRWRKCIIDGTFGDKTVLLTTGVIDHPRGVVLLFHGVHSSASSEPGNKYARIGTALAENGFMPVLTETSRRVRNRQDYAGQPLRWITEAFQGKTYAQELQDFYSAYTAVRSLHPRLPLTLWGFSLGGLSALLIAGGAVNGGGAPADIDGLIICGSGDRVFEGNAEIFKLPILDSLENTDELLTAAGALKVKWAHVFRGTEDTTFPSDACRRIYSAMPTEKKDYYEVEGSDHSFRLLHGSPSNKPLEEVYRRIPELFGLR
ncbi:MAG: alpha/beta hydrolase [Pyramidobacter sp.]|jgi:alpha-beta hydrolase superfamily lysophospholipase